MSQTEFNNLLESLSVLSPQQMEQLRDQLDNQLAASRPQSATSVFDVLNRAGLIGCLDTASNSPTDLSTNPAHMEGFGRD